MGESVEMVVEDNGDVIFEGWDREAEDAWVSLGGEPSFCWILDFAIEKEKLDELLMAQIAAENIKESAMLVAVGADVNAKTNTGLAPLHWAAEQGSCDIVEFLIESGAEVDIRTPSGFTPLHKSVINGHVNVVILLLWNGADVNARARTFKESTPLQLAALNRHSSIVALLERWIAEH
jgi:ankyrin repeat protein